MPFDRGPDLDHRAIFDATPEMYLVLDPQLTIVGATDAYLRAMATTREQILGRHLVHALPVNPADPDAHGPRNLVASLNRVLRTGVIDPMPLQQYDIQTSSDAGSAFEQRFWTAVNSPVLGPDGSVRYLLHRMEDVTEFVTSPADADRDEQTEVELRLRTDAMAAEVNARSRQAATASRQLKEANAELAELYEKTRELAQVKNQFFAAVSHELRTPLSLVLTPVERLLAETPEDDPRHADLEVVRRNAQVLLGHVNDLLDVTKLDTGSIRLDYADVDLGALVRLVGAFFESHAVDRAITLRVISAEHVHVQADQEQLKRVLSTLLENALSATPADGQVRLELRRYGSRAVIEVADSGPGIAPEHRPNVFEPFHQPLANGLHQTNGASLALSVANDLVGLHRGTCSVGEAAEGGALFTVSLPLRAPAGTIVREADPIVIDMHGLAAIRRPASIERSDADEDEGGRPVVLVVEDNPELNRLICDTLGDTYRTISAYDGAAGLAAALADLPDLIICDLMMPAMGGDELVAAIRADNDLSTTPILVLSARADDHARLELLRAGVNDYLVKPFAVGELRARVNNVVSVRQAETRLRALRMTSERDRIARDLHDVVIQRLFALGMRLDAVLRFDQVDMVRQRISETVEELDDVIRDIRSTIFDLQRPLGAAESLRSQVMAICAAAGEQVGCTPRVGFDGPVDAMLEGPVAQQLLAVLQEAMSNVVRHAYASMIEVVVATSPDTVVLRVCDDGVGPNGQASAGNGLRNMASRAEMLGGTFTIGPNEPLGTMVRWVVPLR